MTDGGRLGKLKAKLAEISQSIDEADQRKADAKASIIEAIARLEKAESEVGSIDRRIKLLGQDLKTATDRCDEMSGKLENVETLNVFTMVNLYGVCVPAH